jgi:hypothetical protein
MQKMMTVPITIANGLLLAGSVFLADAGIQRDGNRLGQGPPPILRAVPGDRQSREWIFMLQEEKLARDVYSALYRKWNHRILWNIAGAESRHMNAITGLLGEAGIPDPLANLQEGQFSDDRFQEMYRTLVASGSESWSAALRVGLEIEEMDIADLRSVIQQTDSANARRVFENLQGGSENHLRAFAGQLKTVGGTYVATHLKQEEFDAIAHSRKHAGGGPPREAGRRGGRKRQAEEGRSGLPESSVPGRRNARANSGNGSSGRATKLAPPRPQ